jgi:beta-1,4-glucosyltransferase
MSASASSASISLAGLPILSTTSAKLSTLLQQRLQRHQKTSLVFANTNLVMQCPHLRTWLQDEEVVVVNDGVGVDIAALLFAGKRFKENLNGTDFSPYLLKDLKTPHKLFLLGGAAGVAEKAGSVIEREYGHQVVGIQDGFAAVPSLLLINRINASGADVVLVALGNPRQEEWVRAHSPQLSASLLMCVGALFDFLSGNVHRAPRWMQAFRLEWLFRLGREPRRLLRRYTLDIALFFILCLRYRRYQPGTTMAGGDNP